MKTTLADGYWIEQDPKHNYQVRYNHRSTQTADSYVSAMDLVRSEMLPSKATPVEIAVEDGTYIYLSVEDAQRDDTGARAYAVICAPNQQAD